MLKKDIADGAVFDIALLPRPEIDELVKAGRIGEGATVDVTRSAVGLAVRSGAPNPDISTVAAFKAALLAAKSISYSDGPSGAYVAGLLEKLGIAAAMKPKTKLTSRPVAELVAAGEAEIGLQQIVAILPVRAPTWSAHCRPNCRMSSYTLLVFRPARWSRPLPAPLSPLPRRRKQGG